MADRSTPYVAADLALARRLEGAEARSNADFVEARARVSPVVGAEWIEVAGAFAMFDGVASPLTQTFGLGMVQPLEPVDLDRIEAFFRRHQAPTFHEVSPLADPTVLALLNDRQYRPIEFTNVMCRPITADIRLTSTPHPSIHVRTVGTDEHELWARTAARGWVDSPELASFMLSLAQVSARRQHAVSFIAELEGQAVAAAAVSLHDGVALLAGASTIPTARRQGAQLALLETRLRYAAAEGCDLAMICAQPGSASQRNAERQGFRIAYTRLKWAAAQTSGVS